MTEGELPKIPTLDVEGFYPFQLVQRGGEWMLDLNLEQTLQRSQFIRHMFQELQLSNGAGGFVKPAGTLENAQYDRHLYFPLTSPLPHELNFSIRNKPVAQLKLHNHQLKAGEEHPIQQLAISETRAYGMNLQPDMLEQLPYSRKARAGFDPKKHAPITDLHTHSTAQIKAEDLLKLAFELDLQAKKDIEAGKPGVERICYPLGLLGKDYLNVSPKSDLPEEKNQKPVKMVARGFSPMKDEGKEWEDEGKRCDGIPISDLSLRQRQAIIRKMQIGPDQTIDFSDMDPEMYRYRNPLAKHPALARGIIRKIAEDYAANGIQYAELSTASMMNPEWLREAIQEIDDIERNGVGKDHKKITIRMLVNLSRTSTMEESSVWLQKVKYLFRHPYIVGDDLTGYEANKTTDFHWVLSNLLQWGRASENTDLKPEHGWNMQDWIVHRVHGGETMKNLSNVGDTISLAYRYFGARIRMGHAMRYKLTKSQERKLEEMNAHPDSDLFATERCMDANQVYRSEELVHNQPAFLPGPRFLGSDGGGALATSPTGLSYSAIAAGWTLKDLETNRHQEEAFIKRQLARDAAKKKAFAMHYGEGKTGLDAFIAGYQAVVDKTKGKSLKDYLPEQFHGKKPFLWAGPSGTSYAALDRTDQETIERAAEFTALVANPEKYSPLLGRVQKEGASRALDIAVLRHNLEKPENKFAVLTRYSGADKGPSGEMAESVSWVQAIPGERDLVPSNMIKYVQKHDGVAFVFAGSDFSKGMVGLAEDRNVPYAMQVPKKGMFAKLAKTKSTESRFQSFDEFVDNVFMKTGPNNVFRTQEDLNDFLRPGIDLRKVAEQVKAMKLGGDLHVNRLEGRQTTLSLPHQ